jgi:spermidine/putrescine transport system substrate-binding protein
MRYVHIFITLFLSFLLEACLCGREDSVVSPPGAASASGQPTVHLAIWNDFVSEDLLKRFEKETGIRVELSTYGTNEEILTKVQAGGTGYDILVPSEYMVTVMTKLGLLGELDKGLIPNIQNIEASYLGGPADPNNTYSLPYLWSFSGIAVNRSHFKEQVTGWHDLFENDHLKGRVGYTDDVRETLGVALKLLGKSLNTQDSSDIDAAKKVLIDMKTKRGGIVGDDFSLIQRGDLLAAQFYSGDAMIAAQNQPQQIEFVIPKEGGSRSTEQLVILKQSPHRKEAHALIDFLLRPESSAQIIAKVFAGPVVRGVREKLPEHLRNHPVIFPDAAKLAAFETILDVGDATSLYEKAWIEFKSM